MSLSAQDQAQSRQEPLNVMLFSYAEIIGDGLYKIPFLRSLRAAWPHAHITWLTSYGTVFSTTLKDIVAPFIDEFVQEPRIGTQGKLPNLMTLVRPLPMPRRYSIIIDTQGVVFRTLQVKRLPHDLFISAAADFLFSDRRPPRGTKRPEHMVDRLMQLLRLAAGDVPLLTGGITVPPEIAARAGRALPAGPVYVGFAPGAGQRVKCWPLERFIEVARMQAARGRVPVFILGPAELEWWPVLREAVPEALFPEQRDDIWEGRFSPVNTIALAQRFRAALANDSGVSHMFGAADTRLLTLYGPTGAEKFRPRVSRGLVLTAEAHGSREMSAIPVDEVARTLETLLD
jgi:ADP-heptose:LPS heptosyltransferase